MLKIRDAKVADLPVIVDFQLRMALETEDFLLDKKVLEKGVASVLADEAKGRYYVVCNDSDVVASMLITPEWSDWRNGTVLWIQSVYVKPEYRQNGIFKMMYQHIRSLVESSSHYRGIRLYVDKTNASAQKVYSAVGMNGEHYQLFEWMKE